MQGRMVKVFHSDPQLIWPTRSSLSLLPASKTLAHYSLLSFLPNLILSSSISTSLPHTHPQCNVLPPNRNCRLFTFPFPCSSLILSLMESLIDLGVKVFSLTQHLSIFFFYSKTHTQAVQVLANNFQNYVNDSFFKIIWEPASNPYLNN